MPQKRVIKAGLIVDDVRKRLSNSELMAKYELSADELRTVLIKLVRAKVLRASEVLSRKTGSRPGHASQRRKNRRTYVKFPLPIRDVASPSRTAFVRDLSEKGFRVAALTGIAFEVGEIRRFEIGANSVANNDAFELEATCRWIRRKASRFKYVLAGYEITRISQAGRENLHKLVLSLNNHYSY